MTSKILAASQRTLSIVLLALCIAALIVHVSRAGPKQLARPERVGVLAGEQELWSAPEAGAAWQRKPAPGEGRIESLTTDPHSQGRVLLCRGGLVWMSQDAGHSWKSPIFGPVEEQGVAAAFHLTVSNTLFLATNQRLLISTNAGKDWTAATPGLKFKWRPLTILVSGKEPNRLYVMTQGDGVYRSDDSGHTWTATNTGLPKAIGAAPVAPIESAVLDPTDPDVVYVVAEAKGIYKTTSGGGTWVRASRGLPEMIMYRTSPWVIAIDPSNPQHLLVWASWPVHSERVDSAFFLSEDGAASWRKIAVGLDHGRVFALQFVEAKVGLAIAITEEGVSLLSH